MTRIQLGMMTVGGRQPSAVVTSIAVIAIAFVERLDAQQRGFILYSINYY